MPIQRCLRRLLGVVLFVVLTTVCGAQEVPVTFDRLNHDNGLSNDAVRCLLQDRRGFLWVGTENGLNRYDGINFTVYRNDSDDPNSISGNAISSLLEDRDGFLWVGTFKAGLNRYDPVTNTFKRFPIRQKGDAEGFPPSVFGMAQDADGVLWFGCYDFLISYNPRTDQTSRFPKPNAGIKNILLDRHHHVWIGDDTGLWLFDRKSGGFKLIWSWTVIEMQPRDVQAMTLHPDGRLFVATWAGIGIFDSATTARIGEYRHSDANPNSLGSDKIISLILTDAETLWAGTQQSGINRINLRTGTVTRYVSDGVTPGKLQGNTPFALCVDRTGVLWVGDSSYGLGKFSTFTHRFHLYRNHPYDANSLSDNYIRGIHQDRAGNVWVGTQFGGLNRITAGTQTITRFRNDPKRSDSLPSDSVWTVFEDHAGVLWVGTDHGIGTFDPVTSTFRRPDTFDSSGRFISILEDRSGTLWFCLKGALIGLSPDRRTARSIPWEKLRIPNTNELSAQSFFEDRFGDIWIGAEDGVIQFSPKTEQVRTFPSTSFRAKEATGPFYATCFLEDRNGDLWIASKGAGIHRYDRAGETFFHLTEKEGLPNNNVYGLFEDRTGNFWVSSDKGVARYNPQTGVFRSFSSSDGLQGLEFNRRAFFQSPNGDIYFGGTNGLNRFNPNDIRENLTPPAIVLTGIATVNRALEFADFTAPSATVNYDDNTFTISFAALDFNAPETNQYRYRMDGVDSDWVKAKKTEATYSKLPPGLYRFRVRGTNNDGVWSQNEAVATIHILPPWWRTWWAYSVYFGLFALTAFGAFRLQANRLNLQSRLREAALRAEVAEKEHQVAIEQFRAKEIETTALERETLRRAMEETVLQAKNEELAHANDRLKELDQIKQSFTAMLVHDLKSPLCAVKSVLELIESEELPLNRDLLELVENSHENLDQVVNLVDEVLEVFRSETHDIRLLRIPIPPRDLLHRCFQTSKVTATARGIRLTCDFDRELPLIDADPGKLERVFSNLLSNAIKFTPSGGSITFKAGTIEGTGVEAGLHLLKIQITDTGRGIPAEDLPYIFDPYRQSSVGQEKVGVGLGLAIVRRVVAAHGGSVSVRSQVGVGSSFTVLLPTVPQPDLHIEPTVEHSWTP